RERVGVTRRGPHIAGRTRSRPLAVLFTNKRTTSSMDDGQMSRRDYLKLLGAGAAATALPLAEARAQSNPPPIPQESAEVKADRERRMRWWHEAKFGMFIHWGLYSVLGRHEWVQEMEGIHADEYAK